VRLSNRLWSVDDGLQPLQPLVASWLLAEAARRAGGPGGDKGHRDRQHLRQGAAGEGKRGRLAQAIDRSRGGWTTKVHALTDVIGRPYALMLTAGNVNDIEAAPTLLERAGECATCSPTKGYDADRLRRSLREIGAVPVIPGRRNRKRSIRYDKQRNRGRHLIENGFCRLKDFRRVATRYDELAANFLSGVALATTVASGCERV
jgi:transposase